MNLKESGKDWRSAGRALLCLGMAAIEGFRLRRRSELEFVAHRSFFMILRKSRNVLPDCGTCPGT